MEKVRECQLFMTSKDESLFCETLREFNSNIFFLDVKPSFEGNIEKRLARDVANLKSEYISIVNFDLISKDELRKCYKIRNGYYYFYQLGRAQMQFLRSIPDVNVENCLQHGRIADSYDVNDHEEKIWKSKVYNILKRLGQKVYWYYTLPDGTREITMKAQSKLIALPDAVTNYNGKSGNFMINNRAMFVPEGITLDEINDNPELI